MDALLALSAIGTFLGALAAWGAIASPRAKAVRQSHRDARHRAQEVHAALYGTPEQHDESGAVIAEARPGLLADMRTVLARPILNGTGEEALAKISKLTETVSRLDRRTSLAIARIAEHVREHEAA